MTVTSRFEEKFVSYAERNDVLLFAGAEIFGNGGMIHSNNK